MSDSILPAALRRRRDYAGPALFSYGFRPLFLGAAIWSAFGVILWLPQYFGEMALPTAFAALDWHIHEMIFGYIAAVIAGFLLTAIPNWTGRLPVNGYSLAGLVALWLAGRIAIAISAVIGAGLAAVIDISFLAVLTAVSFREIFAGRNWRNLRVLSILSVLVLANIVFHVESIWLGAAYYGLRLSIAAVVLLITLIGGRIVPSFTHNWLMRNNPGRLPRSFGRFDMAALAAGAVALLTWVAAPDRGAAGVLLLIGGLFHAVRLARWAGNRTFGEGLVLVLHIAYGFVPFGFVMLGLAILWPSQWPLSAGLHAWMTGAVGLMTLAVMTRASLGHTGRALTASVPTQLIYLAALVAAIARIAAAFAPSIALLHVAAGAWSVAFIAFAVAYGPALFGTPLQRSVG